LINFGQCLAILLLYAASNVGGNLLPWQSISMMLLAICRNFQVHGALHLHYSTLPVMISARYPFQIFSFIFKNFGHGFISELLLYNHTFSYQ
jgi:hypothetical protein